MKLLNMLMGLDNALGDLEIASDMLKDSKFEVISLAKATLEVANPQLRELLEMQLFKAIFQHHHLSDLASDKDWYRPFLAPEQRLIGDIELANSILP